MTKTYLGLALSTSASLPQKKALVIFDTGSSDFVIDKSLPINNLNEPFDFSYFNSGFDVKQDPFVWAAKKQHLIQPSSFQFTFRHGGKASLNIGLFNPVKHAGLISWVDKNSDKTFWRTSVELNKNKNQNAIV